MTNPSIHPCPVCAKPVTPESDKYCVVNCDCIYGSSMRVIIDGWLYFVKQHHQYMGKVLHDQFNIHTLSELESRLAPDPRVAELEKSERELSDAYLRVRKLLNAYDTKFGGADRFEVTEAAIVALQEKAKSAAPDPRVAVLEASIAEHKAKVEGEWHSVMNPNGCRACADRLLWSQIAAQRGEGV